jgi:hypothetical protein
MLGGEGSALTQTDVGERIRRKNDLRLPEIDDR